MKGIKNDVSTVLQSFSVLKIVSNTLIYIIIYTLTCRDEIVNDQNTVERLFYYWSFLRENRLKEKPSFIKNFSRWSINDLNLIY